MAVLLVPSQYPSIAAAMLSAAATDTIQLESGYRNESATVTVNDITVSGGATSTGIVLTLGPGVPLFATAGSAPINIFDASDGNGIVGNAGNNQITVTGGVDAVDGGLGVDRLFVDYHLATGAVTGDSTSNFTEAGGGARSVTITNGTIEHFTVLTGDAADTLTTGAGNDLIRAGDGANTITAGQGRNIIYGGADADTITALDGGNCVVAGDGANTVTTGNGNDTVSGGTGADTVTTGGGSDIVTARGGADTISLGSGNDRLTVDYSHMTTSVSNTLIGDLASGYSGILADAGLNTITFTGTENFTITAGSGADSLLTGGGRDVLYGGAGNDILNAGAGKDTLGGGAGSDVLIGGTGADVLKGGSGADQFRFLSLADSPTNATHDRIIDFQSSADKLDVSAIDANPDMAGDQAFHFLGGGAFTGEGGELRYSGSGGNTFVSADTDGDLNIDFLVQLDGTHTLSASNFLL